MSNKTPPGDLRKLIVNADDFGWSKSVNRGIVDAYTGGIVTAASILANGVAFEHAVELAETEPNLAIGMHLNLYRGTPVLDPALIPSLVDAEGQFLGSAELIIWRALSGQLDPRHVRAEFSAQIVRVKESGISPSHLNSDKHLHIWPSLFRVVCEVAREFEIHCVRVVREPPSLHPIASALTFLSASDARTARRYGLSMADGTIGVAKAPTDIASLAEILARARGRVVELMVHPGYVDQEFLDLQQVIPNHLGCAREEQLDVLRNPEARALVERHLFRLRGTLNGS